MASRLDKTPEGVKLGEYIKMQRESLGISLRQLAGRIGHTTHTWLG